MPSPLSNVLTVSETLPLLKSGALTVTQLVQDHITRYDERDPIVHAWAYFDRDRALREAARLDAIPAEKRGPLHGVIIGVKDMMSASPNLCRTYV
jgi:Asp-tRNA(Asn)/Glu-tRNA(Gln) amidotransferase A subunit family amidase